MFIFLLVNIIVGLSAFLLNSRVIKFNNTIDWLLSLFMLYFTQIITTELILGALGFLYLYNIVALNLIILSVTWYTLRHKESVFIRVNIREALNGILNKKVLLFATSAILGFGLVKIFINLVNPPFGWDDLNYHFTFPVEWLKHGNLDTPITIFDDPGPSYYPINSSLFYLWLIFPLKNVFLADLGQIPFFIIGGLAVYSLARKLNLSRKNAYLAVCLFTLIPNYFKQMEIAYIDVMVAALFLVCLNSLFLLSKEFSFRASFIFSLALGLLLGLKTIALPYSILLFIPFLYICFKHNGKAVPFLISSILVIVALGGFSYLRNFFATGNPLYPLDFKLFGTNIFKGVVDTNTYRAHFKPEDYRLSKWLFHEGLGAQSLIFILPSIFLALPLTLLKIRKDLDFNLTYFLLLPFLLYVVYRYFIPLANLRYLYALLGMGMIIAFYTVELLKIPKAPIKALVVICILASISELASHAELVASIIITLLLFIILPILRKRIRQVKSMLKLKIWVLCGVFIALIFLEQDYIRNEYPRYIKMEEYSGFWPDATRAWEWLNKDTKGNNIAYVGRPVPFPLYGTNFKNNVYYVSVNKTEPAKLHYFPASYYSWDYDFLSLHRNLEKKGNYRSDANYAVWLNNLLRRNTDYLFIYSLHQTTEIEFPLEDNWAKVNPAKFSPVFTNQTIHIYKILK